MNQPLLSYDSIERIRQYVRLKFPHLPKEKHAEIVADAISKVVVNQLPSFQYETKKTIADLVIQHIVVDQKRPLLLQDIVQVCEQYPLLSEERDAYLQWRAKQHANIIGQASQEEASREEHLNEEIAATNTELPIQQKTNTNKLKVVYTFSFILLFTVIYLSHQLLFSKQNTQADTTTVQEIIEEKHDDNLYENLMSNELPDTYKFINFDKAIIISYLNTRDSLLVEEPYFTAIYDTAYEFNIHPVLLFAITGQEQGFVPRHHEYAYEIVQNPFNVFYSWQDYNTNIEDTTAIAARTIVNLSKDRPNDMDALKWINRKYAEDEKWHEGVSSLFNSIVNHQIIE